MAPSEGNFLKTHRFTFKFIYGGVLSCLDLAPRDSPPPSPLTWSLVRGPEQGERQGKGRRNRAPAPLPDGEGAEDERRARTLPLYSTVQILGGVPHDTYGRPRRKQERKNACTPPGGASGVIMGQGEGKTEGGAGPQNGTRYPEPPWHCRQAGARRKTNIPKLFSLLTLPGEAAEGP